MSIKTCEPFHGNVSEERESEGGITLAVLSKQARFYAVDAPHSSQEPDDPFRECFFKRPRWRKIRQQCTRACLILHGILVRQQCLHL